MRGVSYVACLAGVAPSVAAQSGYRPPDSVVVLPVFFVAQGERTPTVDQADRFLRHLEWSRASYAGWLGDGFRLGAEVPYVVEGQHPLAHYRAAHESGVPEVVAQLFDVFDCNRFTCPSVFVVVFVNPRDRFPVGGGRPFNGGYNTGGGIVVLSTYLLDRLPNFQSTLEHELGHAFGLPHVDVYGGDMERSPSIMSYNQDHLTDGFNPAPVPGRLLPRDVLGLSLNRRVFPNLDPDRVRAAAGDIKPHTLVWLGPMETPGQPSYRIEAGTSSGATFGSSVKNVTGGAIAPNTGPGVTYDARTMWTSGETATGWVDVDLTFPVPVTLTGISVHSQHSGRYHEATAIRIETLDESNSTHLIEAPLATADARVDFPQATATHWRLQFRAGPTRRVVIRGLRFFDAGTEIVPPMIPQFR